MIDNTSAKGTTNFINLVVKLWRIFNVHGRREDQVHNDQSRAAIRMCDDPRLQFLLDIAGMAHAIKAKEKPRFRSLTSDTAKFLVHI